MTDEILKNIYEMKQNSEYLTEEEAIAKYKEEYKSVCEGTEKIYNLVWKQILEKAFLNNERIIYVNVGHSASLTNSRHFSDDPRYNNYFKLHDSFTKDIWWFSLDEDDKNIIFFIMDDLKEKVINDGLEVPDQAPYGVRFVMYREKLNEFIALAEEKYALVAPTFSLNRVEEEQNLDKENLLHINSLRALLKNKYNKDISISEMIDYLKDVMNFDDMQIYLYKYELVGLKLNLNDKLKKLFGLKSNEEILKIYDTLQNFDEDNISVLKRELSTEED